MKGPRAGLGSSPPVEGPVDPSGPSEYTEQTMDADSQVGIFRSTSSLFLHEMEINLFFESLGNVHPPHQHPKSCMWLSSNSHDTAAGHQGGNAGERGLPAQSPVWLGVLRRGLRNG